MSRKVRITFAHSPAVFALVSALALLLSLGTVLQTYAMPVEARTTESWFAYTSSVGFRFTTRVIPGKFYSQAQVKSDDLMQIKLPVEPAQYRRVIISKFADEVHLEIPYSFQADRSADVTARFGVDGMVIMPGIWQQAYPIQEHKELPVVDGKVHGSATVTIPLRKLLADMEESRTAYGISLEPQEIRVKPVLDVSVGGLRQPVALQISPEFVISMRSGTVELDEPRVVAQDKVLSETTVVPLVVNLLGQSMRVSTLRQVSMVAAGLFIALALVMVVLRRKAVDDRTLIQRLGTHLVTISAFELPEGTAIADLQSARELLQLQAQTERPVMQVGWVYYLLDGTTCYRLSLKMPSR